MRPEGKAFGAQNFKKVLRDGPVSRAAPGAASSPQSAVPPPRAFLRRTHNACVSSSRQNAALFYGSPYTINARAGGHSYFKKVLRDGPVSRVLSSAVIYLRVPSPIRSSGIHGCIRAGNPCEHSPTLHRTGFTWHGALPSRR